MRNRGEQSPTQWQGSPLERKPKSTEAPRYGRVSGRRPISRKAHHHDAVPAWPSILAARRNEQSRGAVMFTLGVDYDVFPI